MIRALREMPRSAAKRSRRSISLSSETWALAVGVTSGETIIQAARNRFKARSKVLPAQRHSHRLRRMHPMALSAATAQVSSTRRSRRGLRGKESCRTQEIRKPAPGATHSARASFLRRYLWAPRRHARGSSHRWSVQSDRRPLRRVWSSVRPSKCNRQSHSCPRIVKTSYPCSPSRLSLGSFPPRQG